MNDEETSQSVERSRQAPETQAEGARPEVEVELLAARKRIDELTRAWQALDRDREDFKKRLNRERERMIDVERGNVATTLLEAIDGLDLALKNADDSPLAQGVRLVREDLLKRVQALGIERFSLVGQPFDPNVAEAADMDVTLDPQRDGHVTEEIRAGYRLKDRVVRPARVKVARYVAPARA
jgi:molecular chaperone GrpE